MKKLKLLMLIALVMLVGCDTEQDLNFHLYDDHKFIYQAYDNSSYQAVAAALSASKTQNNEVRSFAELLINDHTKANENIRSFSERKGINLPDTFNTENQVELMIISQIEGVNFDNRYLTAVVRSYSNDIAKFDSAARFANDAEIKEWAAQQVPILQSRHQEAERLQSITNSNR